MIIAFQKSVFSTKRWFLMKCVNKQILLTELLQVLAVLLGGISNCRVRLHFLERA
nr:MAG TPA: hypothetical protein [Caudoviricetes sp.]